MVKKLKKLSAEHQAGNSLAETVKDSAQQIWLAGLGAFGKAQAEGGKVFEALVKEGLTLQKKTQTAAEAKLDETTSRVSEFAQGISSRAAGQWDKLESIFEDRVARSLSKLGMPTAAELQVLAQRVEILEKALAATTQPVKVAANSAATKPVAKKASARKAAVKTAVIAEETLAVPPVKPRRTRPSKSVAPV
jgi:poly(hydroxyalkanoate) granule-associated protein